jgi:hypothetical protein
VNFLEVWPRAVDAAGAEEGDHLFLAVKSPVNLEKLIGSWAEDIAENLAERATEEYGEVAEDWPCLGDNELAILDQQVRDVIKAFIEKHDPITKFWGVRDVRQYLVGPNGEQVFVTSYN